MADSTDKITTLLATLVAEVHGVRAALEAMAIANSPEPRMVKGLGEYAEFDWSSINAAVVGHDKSGPTLVEWGGFQWKRRSKDEYGMDIFFTRPNGKMPDGRVRYLRLITFRGDTGKVKPIPEATREAIAEQEANRNAKAAPVIPKSVPKPVPATRPQAEIDAQPARLKAEVNGNLPAKPAQPQRYWSSDAIKAVLHAKLAADGQSVAKMLNLSTLSPKDPLDIIIKWCETFTQAIKDGQEPAQAAFLADTGLPKPVRQDNAGGGQ